MDLGSILLVLALMVIVVLFISQPFLDRRIRRAGVPDGRAQELSALLAERDRILNALQELDFDHALGKIPEEDYPLQRAGLVKRGADVLRRLDTIQPAAGQPAPAGGPATAEEVEARIEAAIAARRVIGATQVPALAGGNGSGLHLADAEDSLEVMLANRRRIRREKAAGFCPQCGGALQKSDRFCPKCGAKLA